MNNIFNTATILNTAITFCWIALFICSIIALTIIVERFIYLTKIKALDNTLSSNIIKLLKENDTKTLITLCETYSTPLSNIISNGLKNKEKIKEVIQIESNKELLKLEKFISALSTISTIAPLLGLLGTIIGMIQSFSVIATIGATKPTELASGISNALLTTAAGLIIAIPTVVFYNYFVSNIDKRISFMENITNEIIREVQND